MKKIAADRNYRMMKIAENTALSENAILSNNRITMIRISLLSMGIKEILGLMGIVGAAFGLGKWGGWIKDKWDSLTGKEKEDAGDQEIVQNLIASLSSEELEALYYEILAHREIEELVDVESIAPKGVSSRLEPVMREISDKFEKEIIENDQEEALVLDEKKIAADRNYRMLKRAKKRYTIEDFNVGPNLSLSGKSWKTNSAIVLVSDNPGMLNEPNEAFYTAEKVSDDMKKMYGGNPDIPSYVFHRKHDAEFLTQDGEEIKGLVTDFSIDGKAALVFWSESKEKGWVSP